MTSTGQLCEPTREAAFALLESLAASDLSDTSSRIQHLLGFRLIGYQECFSGLEKPASKVIQSPLGQVLTWRLYCNGWLENHPQAWMTWRRLVKASQAGWAQRAEYQTALAGQTGIELFDDWMVRLRESGHLSAEEAKCFASIWIYSLKLPWSLGADLFCRYSLDINLAVHLLNWRTVAGLQVKNEHFSVSAKELVQRFGDFRGQELVLESPLPPSFPSPPKQAHAIDYPVEPGESLGPDYALLLTPEDLQLEELAQKLSEPKAIVILDSSFGLERGDRSGTFIDLAVRDAATRARTLFSSPVLVLSNEGQLLAEQLKTALAEFQVNSVSYHQPCIGEWQEKLLELARRDVGLRYFPLQRAWERRCYGLAVKGFRSFTNTVVDVLLEPSS